MLLNRRLRQAIDCKRRDPPPHISYKIIQGTDMGEEINGRQAALACRRSHKISRENALSRKDNLLFYFLRAQAHFSMAELKNSISPSQSTL